MSPTESYISTKSYPYDALYESFLEVGDPSIDYDALLVRSPWTISLDSELSRFSLLKCRLVYVSSNMSGLQYLLIGI
jgi:hypothetical protein